MSNYNKNINGAVSARVRPVSKYRRMSASLILAIMLLQNLLIAAPTATGGPCAVRYGARPSGSVPTHAVAPSPTQPRTSGRRRELRANGSWPVATRTSAAEPRGMSATGPA